MVKELSDKNRTLTTNYNSLFEKHEILSKEINSDRSIYEKKVMDSSDREKRLQDEVNRLKEERDRKMIDHQKETEKDKSYYKTKLHEVEVKCREAESKRTSLMFEFEKEKAGWGLKQDHM